MTQVSTDTPIKHPAPGPGIRVLRRALATPLPVLGSVLVGMLIGWVGRFAFVLGLLAVGLGLTAGALTGVAQLVVTGVAGRRWLGLVALSVVAGWCAFQWMDDVHFQETFRADFAAARFADSGASADEAITDDDIAFYGEDAPFALESQVRQRTGRGGVVGRWLFRAEAGVRLVGPWNNGRGVAVGLAGAIVWALVEVFLAIVLARAVIARMGRLRQTSPADPSPSSDILGDLDHEGGEHGHSA